MISKIAALLVGAALALSGPALAAAPAAAPAAVVDHAPYSFD